MVRFVLEPLIFFCTVLLQLFSFVTLLFWMRMWIDLLHFIRADGMCVYSLLNVNGKLLPVFNIHALKHCAHTISALSPSFSWFNCFLLSSHCSMLTYRRASANIHCGLFTIHSHELDPSFIPVGVASDLYV